MNKSKVKRIDLAEVITEKVMELLAFSTPVWVADGSTDENSFMYSNEAQIVFDNVLEILEDAK
jgi:hypothetical protein